MKNLNLLDDYLNSEVVKVLKMFVKVLKNTPIKVFKKSSVKLSLTAVGSASEFKIESTNNIIKIKFAAPNKINTSPELHIFTETGRGQRLFLVLSQ